MVAFPKAALVTAVAGALVANAATVAISVGPGLVFNPPTATPAVGDTLQFTFAGPHSVTQSTFNAPCTSDNGFDSGIASQGQTFTVAVNDTNPIWIYCKVPGHCQAGMVFAANAPTSGTNTYDNFKTLAMGGTISSSNSTSASSSAPAASSSAPSSGSSGGGAYGGSGSSGSGAASQFSKGWAVVVLGVVGGAVGALL